MQGTDIVEGFSSQTLTKPEGYRTAVSAKLYDGRSGGKKRAANDNTPSTDKVADNTPEGTPATPSEWVNSRRYGRTDEN
ncbi:hypothetical protein AKG11_32985 [Shinella sp. SUS2]|nr:hypothetical protein AKG11_32985 [Shinella sp. SUS2]KOC71466.1 hypothetical protein AKG10_32840 [Shinella sp. GWS1]